MPRVRCFGLMPAPQVGRYSYVSAFASRTADAVDRRPSTRAHLVVYLGLLATIALAPAVSSSAFDFPGVSNSWVLIAAAALTLVPLIELSHPRSLRNLDLIVLVAPTLAIVLDQRSRAWPVLLVYPALAYLCVRMISIARAPITPPSATAPASTSRIPTRWLLLGIVVLLFVHVDWALTSTVRNDSGEGGVQGAQRLIEGKTPYGASATRPGSPHGDVYGPVLYAAYTPFAALLGDRDAERIACLVFDLLTALLLFLLGNQLRGPTLGVLAAYCWLAFPVTFYEDALGFNDGLVAASLIAVLLAARSPARRGAFTAVAACGKLSPLALVPLLATYRPRRRPRPSRDLLVFSLAFLAASAVAFAAVLLHTAPAIFLSRTLGFQASREPSDSIWSALQYHYGSGHPWLVSAGHVLHGLVVALAGALVIISYRLVRTPAVPALAAACAAVLIAVEASLGYYAYSYLLWVVPLMLVALLVPSIPPTPAPSSPAAQAPGLTEVPRARRHEVLVTKA